MKQSIDRIVEAAAKVADSAVRVTSELLEKGKDKVDKTVLQNRLSKAQRQLGELVYVLRKTGENNEPMIANYIEQIDRIKTELDLYMKAESPCETVFVYEYPSEEEGEAQEGATFCDCGNDELS